MTRYLFIIAIGLSSLRLGGCTSYSSPKLSVIDARVTETSVDAVVLMFTIETQNDNNVELPLREAKYTLTLDGKPVFTGYRSPQTTIQRHGSQLIRLPAVIPIGEDGVAPTGVQRYSLNGTLVYITPGQIAELLFDAKLKRPSVRFRDRGTINFDEPVDSAPVSIAE